MIARKLYLLLFLVLGVCSAFADELDRYLRAQMEEQHIPGLSMAVLRRGKPVRSQGYGYADIDRKVAITANTVFQLQSITKTFTATAVMMLVEDNKLSVEDKISKYLQGTPPLWERITIRHLLTHTSGIKDFINEPTVDLTKDIEPPDVIRSLQTLPLNFEPGERYAYSNTGYHLLGMIIEKITGDTWQNFLRARIFKLLKMKNTDVNSATCDLRNRALGYTWRSNTFHAGAYVAPTILGYAGGGILSTVLDLAKWDRGLFEDKLISHSSLDEMWTRTRLNDGTKTDYGFGWGVDDYLGVPMVNHGGAHMTGFKTYFIRFLKQELTVIVLCNSRQANPANIAVKIAGFYAPELQLSRLKEQPDPSPARTDSLKSALCALAAQKESPLVTSQFLATYRNSSERAQSLATRLKDMKSFAFLTERDISENNIERHGVPVKDLCIYRLTTPSESRFYTFYLTRDGLVASYQSFTE
ncbi:MAG TPA: serine hydrolase domain-containing protein [Verrucomicrobiae bacterium]|nr:serine hydrolase domain-containing protein [Verrucomicrobiae bacterium]